MILSDKPTNHILLRAGTGSEWDNCDYAIIDATDAWKKDMQTKLEAVQPFGKDPNFQSLNYYNAAVNFHRRDEDEMPDIDHLLSDNAIVFVLLEGSEAEKLLVPDSRLDCYTLEVFNNGSARFTASGKHTGEQFWTDEFSLEKVIESLKGE